MRARSLIIFSVVFFLAVASADAGGDISYFAVKMDNSESVPDELSFMEKRIQAKGYTGAQLLRTGKGAGSIEFEASGYTVMMKFTDGKVHVLIKKGKKVFLNVSVLVKNKPVFIDGPEVEGGQLIFALKKG